MLARRPPKGPKTGPGHCRCGSAVILAVTGTDWLRTFDPVPSIRGEFELVKDAHGTLRCRHRGPIVRQLEIGKPPPPRGELWVLHDLSCTSISSKRRRKGGGW